MHRLDGTAAVQYLEGVGFRSQPRSAHKVQVTAMSCEVNRLVPSTRFLVSQSQDTWNQAERMRNTYNTVISLWRL